LTDLSGKVALVTGSSGGIGAAICHRLADEGVAVGLGYGSGRDAAERVVAEIGSAGAVARAFGADLADRAAPARLVADVEQALGRVDIDVANHPVRLFDGCVPRPAWSAHTTPPRRRGSTAWRTFSPAGRPPMASPST
jgi:NAD(P)-dependent dehydrogenase (short-subunit alcohol dehydrogenase family)